MKTFATVLLTLAGITLLVLADAVTIALGISIWNCTSN